MSLLLDLINNLMLKLFFFSFFRIRSSTTSVVIRVTDDNDNAPRFDGGGGGFAFSLRENSGAGTVVGRVTATDPDLGRNAELVYSLDDQHRGTSSTSSSLYGLSIDPATGFVSAEAPIDRERLVAETGRDYFQVGHTLPTLLIVYVEQSLLQPFILCMCPCSSR